MSSQKRAQAFRNFVAEPLDWAVAPASTPEESEELVDTEQSTTEEQN